MWEGEGSVSRGRCGFSGRWRSQKGCGEPVKGQHGAHSAQQGAACGEQGNTQPPPGLGGWLSGDSVHPAVTEALQAPGKVPGCSGTRNLHDNLSDLRAQVAANQKGIQLVGELIGQYGLEVVQAYMGHIQVGLGYEHGGSPRQLGGEGVLGPPGRWHGCLSTYSLPGQRGAGSAGHASGLWVCPAGPRPASGGVCRGPHG